MIEKRKKYSQFKREERFLIYTMYDEGKSLREIGKYLGRGENCAGSISRELKRNRPESPFVRNRLSASELGREAHIKTLFRRKRGKRTKKLDKKPELKREIVDLLVKEQASPRDISKRLLEKGEKVAYTTIYSFTKKERPDLRQYHRLRGKNRKQRVVNKRSRFRVGVPEKKRIAARAALVLDNTEFGHLEVDTIHGARGGSGCAILTIRELKSRMRWFKPLLSLEKEETLAVLRGFFKLLPPHMRKTLTVDNGPENADLYELERLFGILVYYCDPYCPSQRGCVENANGEFRWYYPKGTDFQNVTSSQVWEVQDKLNRRRMECLEWKSAESVFAEAVLNPSLVRLVGAQELRSGDSLYHEVVCKREESSNLFLPSPSLWDLNSFGTRSTLPGFLGDGWKFGTHGIVDREIDKLLQSPY